MLRRLLMSLATLSAALLLMAACGSDDDDRVATPTPPPGEPTPAVATFRVAMFDNYFEPEDFTLQRGQQAVFNLVNEGEDIHNMRILHGDDPASTPIVIAEGESGVLEWTAPDEPGLYGFICDYHPEEMDGIITVEG